MPDTTVSSNVPTPSRKPPVALRRAAMACGWAGVVLGICAGVVQLTYGSSMPDWTGDKMDTTGLGLATIGLSLVVGVALWRLLRAAMLWVRAVCPVVALACVVACFTTVGRLWYVPGPLLIVAAVCAFLTAPAVRQADPNGQRGGRQSRGRGDGRAGS